MTSALSVDRNDKRIARSMKALRLTERLTAAAAGQLVEIGAGPYTVRVLENQKQTANLPLPAQDAISITPAPAESEQDQMIGKMRAYVAAYLARFPDFLATKEVRRQMLNGSRLAVFSYRVDLVSSRYAVGCLPAAQPFGKSTAQNVKAGHRGLVFADPHSGAVMRLILIADGFAGNVDSIAAGHVLEYGEVAIGAGRYLLPLRAIAYVPLGDMNPVTKSNIENYRKFASDAEINFAEDAGADPKD